MSSFAEATEIIKLDPSDPKEAKLVAQLKVDPKTKKASNGSGGAARRDGNQVGRRAPRRRSLKAALQKAAEGCSRQLAAAAPRTK